MTTPQDQWVADTFGVNPQDYAAAPEDIGNPFKSLKARLTGKKTSKPGPVPRAAMGEAQSTRADTLKSTMSPEDRKRVDTLLGAAKGEEATYLKKALASSHTADELETFYKAIKGKDRAWMEKNLHVVGGPKGRGVKQQWSMSCAPTSVQAIKAELDPVYALKLRTENPNLADADDSDGTRKNPNLAQEQSDMLASGGAAATPRDSAGAGLSVSKVEGLFNDTTAATGVAYKTERVEEDKIDAALSEMETALAGGLPVPILVGDSTGAKHAVLVTGVDPGPPRRYSIHDPGDGMTTTVSDADIKGKSLNLSGWTEIRYVLKPSGGKP